MAPTTGWRARTFASFARPTFRAYYVGLLCNMAGFWLRIAATNWYAFELTGSRASLGIITMAALLPWVPIAPIAGVWAERIDQRKYLIAVYAGVALVNLVFAAGISADLVGWNLLLTATIATSVLRGMELPARHAIVRRIVDLPLLGNAIGLNAAGFHVMNAVGFFAAGILYKYVGPDGCFYVVGAASLAMAFVLARLDLPPQVAPEVRKHPVRELKEGFAYVWTHGLTRTLVLCAMGVVGLLLSYRVLMPAIAKERLGLDADGYGFIMGISGIGSILAALWVASGSGGPSRRVWNIFLTVWLGCLAVALIGWTDRVWLSTVGLFAAGFAAVGFMASANTTVQETVPDRLRARVMGIWALIFGAAFPLGGLAQGFIAEAYGEMVSIVGGALLAIGLSLVLFATSARKLTVAVCHEVGEGCEEDPGVGTLEDAGPTQPGERV